VLDMPSNGLGCTKASIEPTHQLCILAGKVFRRIFKS